MLRYWIAKRRAARADVEFRDRLRELAGDPRAMGSLSVARRDYVRLACRAMTWWIDGGHAGEPAPETPILHDGAAPRDKILIAYVQSTPREDLGVALRAIAAQGQHMRAC